MNRPLGDAGRFRYLSGGPGTPHRARWAAAREALERSGLRHTVIGPTRPFRMLRRMRPLIRLALRLAGLHRRGERNARSPRLEARTLRFAELPAAFHGYRILHVSDPHFENLPGLAEAMADRLAGLAVDLVAVTGDLQAHHETDCRGTIEPLSRLLGAVSVADAVVVVLGNHDAGHLLPHLESSGLEVLVNEHGAIERCGARLVLSGTDDPNCFYTEAAARCLESPPEGFRVALVHSPELAQAAAAGGHALYLCGHTHGGQICLPGGRPILTVLTVNRHLAKGWWTEGAMVGHTSNGLGSAVLAVRYFCPPSVTLITLQRGEPEPG